MIYPALRYLTPTYAANRLASHARFKTIDYSRFFVKIEFQKFFSSIPIGLSRSLKTGQDHYLFLQRATNQQKIERTVQHALEQSLIALGQKNIGATTEDAWAQLRGVLAKRSISFPPFTNEVSEEETQALFRIFPRKLLRGSSLHTEFNLTDVVNNDTDLYWFYHSPTFPFTRIKESVDFALSHIDYIFKQTASLPALSEPIEQEIQNWIYHSSTEDGLGALLLANPHLDSDTFVHEIGSWNGENLFNLLNLSYLHNRVIAGCLGTDVNIAALNMAEITASIMGLSSPLVQFHLANALTPVHLSTLGISHKKELKVALRVLPVLDPHNGRSFLQAVKKSFQTEKSKLILSYALPEGRLYEQNKYLAASASQDMVHEEQFKGGCIFKTRFPLSVPTQKQTLSPYNLVVNTYYTEEGFNSLIKECGFKIVNTIFVGKNSDNNRAVALLDHA